MQTFIPQFTSLMSWIVLGLTLVGLLLLGLEARRLTQGRRRALVGLVTMLVVLAASTASLIGLTMRPSSGHRGLPLSQWLLPLVTSLLLVAIYRLSFPAPASLPTSGRTHLNTLLLCLCIGAALSAGGLVVLDFLFS